MRFLRYVVAALQTAVPDLPEEVTGLLRDQTVVAVDSFLVDLLNVLADSSLNITLVLDDFHLIQDEAIHEGVAFLLDHMPSNFHLIVTTREDPPLPLARLRGRGQLVEIRQADLAFPEAETAQFLNDVMGLSLNKEAVTALAKRTEGHYPVCKWQRFPCRGKPTWRVSFRPYRQSPVCAGLLDGRGSAAAVAGASTLFAANGRSR